MDKNTIFLERTIHVSSEIDIFGYPAYGTLTLVVRDNGYKDMFYTPNIDFVGKDEYEYTESGSDSGHYHIIMTVNEATSTNTKPVALAQSVKLDQDEREVITLSGTDADNDNLAYSIVDIPKKGKVSINDIAATYKPNSGYSGKDSFTFKVNDGIEDSDPATVSLVIKKEDDPEPDTSPKVNIKPIANEGNITLNENTSFNFTLTGSDGNSDPLTYSIVTNPVNGTLSGTAPSLTYKVNKGYVGNDIFTFNVNDGTEDSDIKNIDIKINKFSCTSYTNQADCLAVNYNTCVWEGGTCGFSPP